MNEFIYLFVLGVEQFSEGMKEHTNTLIDLLDLAIINWVLLLIRYRYIH